MLESFIVAFSMYSKIPMPRVNWNDKNMKYSMCYFPLIGLVIGVLFYIWQYVCLKFNIGELLKTSVFACIPAFITGGIHIDGFIDTMDAKSSYEKKERKLEILKDSHIGAFAAISLVIYYILYFGILSEINYKNILFICAGFILSRAFSAFSIVTFKCAKNSGLASIFSKSSEKNVVRIVMSVYIIIISLFMIYISIIPAFIIIFLDVMIFLYYKNMSYKEFGGITGDIAGFFLCVFELITALSSVIVMR